MDSSSEGMGWPDRETKRKWAEEYMSQMGPSPRKSVPHPRIGFSVVPDEKTAIHIAIAIWKPLYADVETERPFHAFLIQGYWVVLGSQPLPCPGGVAQAIISEATGEVIDITHGQ